MIDFCVNQASVAFFLDVSIYLKSINKFATCFVAPTVLPAKSDRYVMFCLQSYQGLIFDRLLVY